MTQRIILDVASYQGPTPNLDGVAGGMIKAVEGGWPNTNPFMDAQAAWFSQHGLPFGFYDFWHPMFAGTSDMQLFISKIAAYQPKLGVAIDAEVNDQLGPVTVLDRLLEDVHFVYERFPMRTWLYTAAWWSDPNLYGPQKADLEKLCSLWLAGYTQSLPPVPYPFTHASMWQFTDKWQGGNQDASLCLLSDEQWDWMIGNVKPVPPAAMIAKIKGVQKAVHAKEDGIFGPDTHNRVFWLANMRDAAHRMSSKAVKLAQKAAGIPETGKYDTLTHDRVGVSIQNMQRAMGASPVDGTWNANTAFAEAVLDPFV